MKRAGRSGSLGFCRRPTKQRLDSNYIGTLTVDDLRIGRNFTDVLPGIHITEITPGPAGSSICATGFASVEHVLQASTNLLTELAESLDQYRGRRRPVGIHGPGRRDTSRAILPLGRAPSRG